MITNEKNTVSKDSREFFKILLRRPVKVGALTPSSEELARTMVRDLNLAPGETVIELGAGTGALTRAIRSKIPDPKSYLGIEREAEFVTYLEDRFPDMNFVKGNAEDCCEIFQNSGLAPVKVIISSLPWAYWPEKVRDDVLTSINQMMPPGCIFRTIQYAHNYPLPHVTKFRNAVKKHFGKYDKRDIVIKNIPPAFVLTWTKH